LALHRNCLNAVICNHRKLDYSILTDVNKKFINVFVRAFIKSDATEPKAGKSSYRPKKFHAPTSLIQMLLAIVLQIVSA